MTEPETKRVKKREVIITEVQKIIESYDIKLTLRQIFYRLVGKTLTYYKGGKQAGWHDELYENSMNNYKALSTILVDARKKGLIDPNAIEDRIRKGISYDEWNPSNKDAWERYMGYNRWYALRHKLHHWIGQDDLVVIVLEKDALSGVFGQVTKPIDVPLLVSRGYSSYTQLRNVSETLEGYLGFKRIVFLTFGDFDPTGMDIMRNFKVQMIELLKKLNLDVQYTFKEVALNREQIDLYRLPPVPAKKSDSRASGFIAEHGDEIVELDAVDPNILQDMIRVAISEYYNEGVGELIKTKTDLQRRDMKQIDQKVRQLWDDFLEVGASDEFKKMFNEDYEYLWQEDTESEDEDEYNE